MVVRVSVLVVSGLGVAHRDVVSDDIIEHLLVRVDAEHLRIGVGVRVRVRVGVRVRVRVRVSLRPCGCRAPWGL